MNLEQNAIIFLGFQVVNLENQNPPIQFKIRKIGESLKCGDQESLMTKEKKKNQDIIDQGFD